MMQHEHAGIPCPYPYTNRSDDYPHILRETRDGEWWTMQPGVGWFYSSRRGVRALSFNEMGFCWKEAAV